MSLIEIKPVSSSNPRLRLVAAGLATVAAVTLLVSPRGTSPLGALVTEGRPAERAFLGGGFPIFGAKAPQCEYLPSQMKAVYMTGASPYGISDGDWNFAYTETAAVPCAGPGEVTVMVNVSSVNPVEWNGAARGGGEFMGGNGELGEDVGGVVVAVGPGCETAKDIGPNAYWRKYGYTRPAVRLGDEVWGNTAAEWTTPVAGQAGFAQFSNLYCDRVGIRSRAQARASAVPITDLGTIPLAAGTSYALLSNAGAPWRAEDNVTVVIASGSGGTGTMAIQEARALGAAHVITASSPNHADTLRGLGASAVVDYHGYDTMFDALADDSVDVVWDNYGYGFDAAARVIRPGGKYITTSLTSGGAWQQAKRQQSDTAARLAAFVDLSTKPGVERLFAGGWGSPGAPYTALYAMVEAGQLRPVVSNRYPLRQAVQMYTEAAGGHALGKLALDVPAPDWDPRAIPGWPVE